MGWGGGWKGGGGERDGGIDGWEAVALHLGIKATYRQGVEEELQRGEDGGIKGREKLRWGDVCWQEGNERERNEESEGLGERDKGVKKGGRSERLR